METHVFTSSPAKALGFTTDVNGRNLPEELGPWEYWKQLDFGTPFVIATHGGIIGDILEHGFHVEMVPKALN